MKMSIILVLIALSIVANVIVADVGNNYVVAIAQNETNTTTTSEPVISINNVTVYHFNSTTISFGLMNETSMVVSYTCIYDTNISDCCRVKVNIYHENGTLLYQANFTNMTNLCSSINGICSGSYTIYIGNESNLTFEIIDVDKNETIQAGSIYIPRPPVGFTGLASLISTLIPVSIFIFLAGRGSIKDTGLGMIAFSIILLSLGYLGIYPQYMYVSFAVSVLLGLILLYMSSS